MYWNFCINKIGFSKAHQRNWYWYFVQQKQNSSFSGFAIIKSNWIVNLLNSSKLKSSTQKMFQSAHYGFEEFCRLKRENPWISHQFFMGGVLENWTLIWSNFVHRNPKIIDIPSIKHNNATNCLFCWFSRFGRHHRNLANVSRGKWDISIVGRGVLRNNAHAAEKTHFWSFRFCQIQKKTCHFRWEFDKQSQ